MKQFTILLLAILLCSSQRSYAQAPTEKSLLWKISGKGIKKPSYLFGTIHLMCGEQIKLDTIIKQCFAQASQLYLEIDMGDPQMMAKAMQHMLMNNDESLANLVDKASFDSMNTIFQSKAGMPISVMQKAKPMLLMSAIFPALLGCAPEGWEQKFQEMAKQKHIPLKGLETIEYQMRVFDTIPYSTQAQMLKNLLFNLDSTKKSFADMLSLYLDKDIAQLHKMTTEDADFGHYEALLLNNRNNNWIPLIAKAVKEQPCFIAVGAAHLGGTSGVIALLRKAGLSVTPVMY